MLDIPPIQDISSYQTPHRRENDTSLIFKDGFRQKQDLLQNNSVYNSIQDNVTHDFVIFSEKWEQKPAHQFERWKNDIAYNLVQKASYNLRLLGITNIITEITPDESILIKAKSKKHDLFLEIFYAEELSELMELTLNVYVEKKHIYATAATSLTNVLQRYKTICV
jgi:hypothetical protein